MVSVPAELIGQQVQVILAPTTEIIPDPVKRPDPPRADEVFKAFRLAIGDLKFQRDEFSRR
jgi:hypothetical protein